MGINSAPKSAEEVLARMEDELIQIRSKINSIAISTNRLLDGELGPITDSMKKVLEGIIKNIVDANQLIDR